MNSSLYIAFRYFLSAKNFNFISLISFFILTSGTAAFIIILSVFNGMEDLLRSMYNIFDPDLKIEATLGKTFLVNESLRKSIRDNPEVAYYSEVIEDDVFIKYKNLQHTGILKGVDTNYTKVTTILDNMYQGRFDLVRNQLDYGVIGRGVQYILGINASDPSYPLQFWYANRDKKLTSSTLSQGMVNVKALNVGGVFSIMEQYDEKYVFSSLQFAEELMNYKDKRTGIEIKVKEGAHPEKVKNALSKKLGKGFKILLSDEQHETLYRAIKIEKLFTFVLISLIIFLASINIYFSNSLLIIRKKKDIAVLKAIGGGDKFIRNIFLWNGLFVSVSGTFSGMFLGALICILQQKFGLVSLNLSTSVVEAYPVALKLSDFLFTGVAMILISFMASLKPSLSANKNALRESLTM